MLKTLPQALPSQRQGQKTELYLVWVCVHSAGWILTGNCTCVAGLGSTCSHVAALLYKLAAGIERGLNEPIACASKVCEWNKSRKVVVPRPVLDIWLKRKKKKSLPVVQSRPRQEMIPSYSCRDPRNGTNPISISELRDLNKEVPFAVVFTMLDKDLFQVSQLSTVILIENGI